ncbi:MULTISPECIES: DUF4238 domain-containing protein [Pseudomonas]|uniref:DUF4238 domain-containing protein n=1 Tax=Pseudomonas TaxID=286 RepID=UPI001F0E3EBA|nr:MULTISPECIES: DUF4238 domain-containing protein [Pseudomonas]MCH5654037.1 DUF4238 domain-containing protein [Pseudomonas syringae]MDA7014120.1 DUF4238 domain-containing protein [Pseudomonas cerasi]
MNQKKRHHFIPKTYMSSFCNDAGRVLVYRKDGNGQPLSVIPDATQFQGYYYSQPKPDGGTDNNKLEDFFCEIEGGWSPIVKRLEIREDINDSLESLFNFMALQRARVPACRDAVELVLAATVKSMAKKMYRDGKLPVLPKGNENLIDEMQISIDPHQSIHAMVSIIKGIGQIIDSVGWVVFHNNTSRPFLTSDNPVVWFDSSLPFPQQKPYMINPVSPILVQFPISPKILLVGASEYRENFLRYGLVHTDTSSDKWVEYVNAQTCRFAYEAVISNSASQAELIAGFSDVSPVHVSNSVMINSSDTLLHSFDFGSRRKKSRWK